MKNSQYEVQVLVNGKPIKQYPYLGNLWIEARKGVNYEVRIKNNSWKRVLAIVSVDGLDVLTGSPASPSSGGYVINAHDSYTVKGFRTSQDEVNLFEFSNKAESYAVQSPDGEHSSANCGGIGVTIIEEKQKPILIRKSVAPPTHIPKDFPWHEPIYPNPKYPRPEPFVPQWPHEPILHCASFGGNVDDVPYKTQALSCSFSDTSVMRMASVEPQMLAMDMGTKFSEESVEDKVTYTNFERGATAEQIIIYYGSRKLLEKVGIDFSPEPKVALPQLFKGNFCKPPKK